MITKKSLKIEYKRFSVPGEYEPVSYTNWFFCCTVHFRTTLTLTMPVPWPEAAPDSDTWLFRNKHFCSWIIQIPCLFRFIWAPFLAVGIFWAHSCLCCGCTAPPHSPSVSVREPVPPAALRYLKHIQYLQCKHNFHNITLKSSGIPFVHVVANQDCFLFWDSHLTVAPWECYAYE